MRKRLIAALLAFAMVLPAALASCSRNGDGGGTTSGGTGTESGQSSAEITTGGGETENPATEKPTTDNPGGGTDEPAAEGIVLRALTNEGYDISDNLFGIFLEDINFAVDGGLYAEMIRNRSFEFGRLAANGGKEFWTVSGKGATFTIKNGASDGTALNENNPHYARIENTADTDGGIVNVGFFDQMMIEKDAEYRLTLYAKAVDGYSGMIHVALTVRGNSTCAEGEIGPLTNEWHKYTLTLKSAKDSPSNGKLSVRIDKGAVDLDMVSLFPVDTYKGRENGMRRDIAEAIEDLHPKFFRFPGGCIIEGVRLDTAYSWKDSIGSGLEFEVNGETTVGDVAARPIEENLWSWNWQPYYMTYGLGFYEYFLFCEDLGCEPVPVLNSGISCEINTVDGRFEEVPIGSPEFEQYVQDALDLVEFCLGDTDTKWGAVRAAMGHPEKFELTYLAIGNEQWSDAYHAHFAKFREAFNKAKEERPELYGGIKLIMANGPAVTDRYGWDYAAQHPGVVDVLDEHYYLAPSWFLMNTSHYDSYDRNAPTVFVGEYAAHDDNRANSSLAAIAEAAYMTSLERNGDVVELAAYAPMLSYSGHEQWAPDLIWYNGSTVWGTVNYYVQKIFMENQSDKVIKSELDVSNYPDISPLTGKVGVGAWSTDAVFDDLTVTDNKTGEVLYSNDFSDSDMSQYEVVSGNFGIEDGKLHKRGDGAPGNSVAGDVLYMGDESWTDYTLTVKATKRSGAEGFLIPFAVGDRNNFWHWNIGGWNNTVSCLEYTVTGSKSGQVSGTVMPFAIVTGREYELKVVVSGFSIKCYIDGELMVDYTADWLHGIYYVLGEDGNDIIVKLVNTNTSPRPFVIDLSAVLGEGFTGKAEVRYIDFISPATTNSEDDLKVTIKTKEIDAKSRFSYELEGYTMAVIRIPKS